MQFEWDPNKAAENLKNHGISFDEASSVFGDPLATTIDDPDHSIDEFRFLTIGSTKSQRIIVVSHRTRGQHSDNLRARTDPTREETI